MSAPDAFSGRECITNAQYHAHPAISKSRLDEFAKSPRHYWLRYLNPNRELVAEDSEALLLGSASHCAVLEPDVFPQRYIAIPDTAPKKPSKLQLNAKKPSAETQEAIDFWQLFDHAAAGRGVLTPAQYRECLALRDCILRDRKLAALLQGGEAEQSFFALDPESGLQIKIRPDWLGTDGLLLDLKFVRDASPRGFGRACAQHRYDVQAAFYPHLLNILYPGEFSNPTFAFIAIEKNEYGPVPGLYFADDDMLSAGRSKFRKELHALAHCQSTNHWPGYTPEPMPVRFPTYATYTESS